MNNIPQMEPDFGQEEADALSAYMLEKGWITEFKKTKEFEQKIADFTGAKHCIVTNNGTVALTMTLLAAEVEPGDEVIVPNLTMIATPNSAKLIGAKPVFVDVEPDTLCLDVDLAIKSITPKTRAIMYVSFNGRCGDIERLKEVCKAKNIKLIEDAAQSLGSFHHNKHVGTYGDMGTFSFSTPKIISTGQGGAIVTDSDLLAKKLRRIKDFGRDGGGNDIHGSMGFNFKFTELQAVVGIEQMKKLPSRVLRKKEMFQRYFEGLKSLSSLKMIPVDLDSNAPWFMEAFAEQPDELLEHLKGKGIGARRCYPPINTQKIYQSDLEFPVSTQFANAGLWLPSSTKVTDAEIDRIIENIREFYESQSIKKAS